MKLSSQSDALLNLPYVKPDVQTQQLPVPAGLISDPPVGMHPDDQATKAFKETLKKTSKSGEIRLSHELNG